MAIVYPYVVQCECGETITANLADGVNAARTPQLRVEILEGRFHKVTCPSCKKSFTAEKSFLYTDFDRGTLIQVKPRQDRHMARAVSRQLDESVAEIPAGLSVEDTKIRVAFGIAELREKLLAESLGLDDRAIELLKVAILSEHPFLLQRKRLRLMFDGQQDGNLRFIASYDLDDKLFAIGLPRDAADDLVGDPDRIAAWLDRAGEREALFDARESRWVNMWRWSPRPGALETLQELGAQLQRGEDIDLASRELRDMISDLPTGDQLPSWAKQNLRLIFSYCKDHGNEVLQKSIIELRFGKPIENDWITNTDRDDLDIMWKLLEALPPSNVEGNVHLREINVDEGQGGGFYEPRTGDIYIGSRTLTNRETFEDVLRHEVGHAVHEARSAEVDAWLDETFGWRMFPNTARGLDEWVARMGGWDTLGVPQRERGDILRFLNLPLGRGSSWHPGPSPNVPPGHSWWGAGFGPRLAYEKSGSNWYNNYGSWYRANGKAFFLNYWYVTYCVVNEDALALVAQMPSTYAAMSTYEFFAELYALYYDRDDPMRGAIPPVVRNWFDNVVGARTGVAMPFPSPRDEFETITRPDG